MKKTLCVLLVLALVACYAFATPVISGRFGVKYTYTYESKVVADGNRNYMQLKDSSDYWSLNFQGMGFDAGTYKGYATLNLDKILAAADIELPVGLSADIGTTGGLSAGYVYVDPTGADSWYLNLTGNADSPVGIGVTYEGWKLYAAAGFESDKTKGFGFDVTGTVVDGVDVEAAFASESKTATASFAVDVAKLAGLDFGLSTGAYVSLDLNNSQYNLYVAGVKASYDAIGAYGEFRSLMGINGIYAGASYKLNSIFSFGAGFSASNLKDFKSTYGVNGYVNASIAGVATRLTVSNKSVEVRTQFTF